MVKKRNKLDRFIIWTTVIGFLLMAAGFITTDQSDIFIFAIVLGFIFLLIAAVVGITYALVLFIKGIVRFVTEVVKTISRIIQFLREPKIISVRITIT